MSYSLDEILENIEKKVIEYRRDFHKYAESAWTEFRTASKVAAYLNDLGYEIKIAKEVIDDENRMGVPSEEILEKEFERAKRQGANLEYLDCLKGGYTGIAAILENGEGPTITFRFDMDAVEVKESESPEHTPFSENFASKNDNIMHACGHDGHTAIGLGLAEVLMKIKDEFSGTIKLIFQPAEEGVRGAKSMVEAGVVDDTDYLIGLHLGLSADSNGEIYGGTKGFLATSKFDAYFEGAPSHAGAQPELGKNAMLAAANAISNLYSISRHSQGVTRINVGRMSAGSGRNVIPANAHLVIETRGENSKLNNYIYDRAQKILKNSAEMYDVDLKVKAMGGAESGQSDTRLSQIVNNTAEKLNDFNDVNDEIADLGGSEDFTYFMKRVQENGGLATYIMLGSELEGAHHTAEFDIDESNLIRGVKLLAKSVINISNN